MTQRTLVFLSKCLVNTGYYSRQVITCGTYLVYVEEINQHFVINEL